MVDFTVSFLIKWTAALDLFCLLIYSNSCSLFRIFLDLKMPKILESEKIYHNASLKTETGQMNWLKKEKSA